MQFSDDGTFQAQPDKAVFMAFGVCSGAPTNGKVHTKLKITSTQRTTVPAGDTSREGPMKWEGRIKRGKKKHKRTMTGTVHIDKDGTHFCMLDTTYKLTKRP